MVVDFRPFVRQDQPGNTLFAAEGALGDDYTLIVEGDLSDAIPGAGARRQFESALSAQTSGHTLLDWIMSAFTLHADPAGEDRQKPLMPGTRGWQWRFGGRRLWRRRWSPNAPEAAASLDLLRREYRQHRVDALAGRMKDEVHHRRILDYRAAKLRVDPRLLVPSDVPFEPRVPHETTISDDFNRSDADALGSSSEGWSWTEVNGDTDIVSNQAKCLGGSARTNRADSDLSSDDHYAEITMVTASGGPAARFSASANTFYLYLNDGNRLFRVTSGSYSAIADEAGVTFNGSVMRIQVDGPDIECFDDGVSLITYSDMGGITGNVRTGFYGDNNSVWDDFSAADLAVGGSGASPVLYRHRRIDHLLRM